MYYLERACRLQVLALSTGRPLRPVADKVARETYAMLLEQNTLYADAHFGALKRILDRDEPDYSS